MQLTQKERDETLASCRKNARQCRETAGRLRLADQREAMEQTAKMWDDLAATLCDPVAALDELLNNAVSIADHVSIVPDMKALDTDESGVAEVIRLGTKNNLQSGFERGENVKIESERRYLATSRDGAA
jgi:hypothetical protein